MLRPGRRVVPRTGPVLALADRGLYARWRCQRITRLGWHPFVRINTGGTVRLIGQRRRVPLQTLGPQPGTTWQGAGIACTGRKRLRPWTLLACGEAGEKAPGLRLTDLSPEASTACWDGGRA